MYMNLQNMIASFHLFVGTIYWFGITKSRISNSYTPILFQKREHVF